MSPKIATIAGLYPAALAEGEGIGTAYEYFVKLRKLKKFIAGMEKPRRVLIAGLPERYGLSLDFFLLAHTLGADVLVVDERKESLDRARQAVDVLMSRSLAAEMKVNFVRAEAPGAWGEMGRASSRPFDLALACEVFQRLEGSRRPYLSGLEVLAKNIALFVPNGENDSHTKLSGLRGVSLEELQSFFRKPGSPWTIVDSGYVDIPPFPPGAKRSQAKRNRAAESRFERLLMKGLEAFGRGERFMPKFFKKSRAHIVYVMARNGRLCGPKEKGK